MTGDDRSWLYVPATDARRTAKVLERGADAVIVDLEDSVAAGRKQAAREATRDWLGRLQASDSPGAAVWVRINAGEEGLDDLLAIGSPPVLTGIVVPKAERAADLHRISGRLDVLEHRVLRSEPVALAALVESVAGAELAGQLAAVPRVRCLHLGEADLAADLDVRVGDDEAFLGYRHRIVHASRLEGLGGPVGPVSTEFGDEDAFRDRARRLIASGFSGIACIHPRQVRVTNEEFARRTDHAWASDTLDRLRIAEESGAGVGLDVDGRMIDEALARRARLILQREG